MKKRVISFVCSVALGMTFLASPMFVAGIEGETVVETEKESDIAETESVQVADTYISESTTEQISQETESNQIEQEIMTLSEPEPEPEIQTKTESVRVESRVASDGKFSIDIEGILENPEIKSVYVPVWNQKDQSDIYWYRAQKQSDGSYLVNAEIKNHKYHLGNYYIHIYAESQSGEMNFIASSSVVLNEISVGDLYQGAIGEYSRTLVLDSVEDQGIAEKVYFAVWSQVNGQDDIYWYEAIANGSTYSADVLLYNHKSTGIYNVHAYISGKDGRMQLVKTMTFQVDKLPKDKVEVANINNNQGKFDVKLYLNRSQSEIDTVYLAAWTTSNQSDIYWYEAKRQSDGSYLVNGNVKNHQNHIGQYLLHGYVKDKKGNMILIGTTNCTLKLSAGNFIESMNSNGYSTKLLLSDVQTQGIADKVYFAVWSQANGQDDIYWYETAANGNAYSADVMFFNHRDAGSYNAHAYILGKDGKMHLLKTMTFRVDTLPKDEVKLVDVNNTKGKFNVKLYVNRPEDSINTVYLAAWTTSNQSDIYWYEAKRQSDGSYHVSGDIKNHQYNVGKYLLHGYVRDNQGNMIFLGAESCTLQFSIGELSAVSNNNLYSKRLVLSNAQTQGLAEKIYFAVWSAKNGQDDIYWYEALADGQNYVSDVLLYNHKDLGAYYVHAYLQDRNGGMHFLKDLTFSFDATSMPTNQVVVSNINQQKGTFDVSILLTSSQRDVKTVYVPVWTKSDQSDIFWYIAPRQKDGSYRVTVDAINHQWNSGKYIVHTYIQTSNGAMKFVKGTNISMKLGTKVSIETLDTRSVRVKVYGLESNVSTVQLPAWSVENGQDDLVWYTGTKNSDGSWSADIHTKNHKTAGSFICDVYASTGGNSRYIDRAEFNIAEKWEGSWRWIDGYKRYINESGEVDNDVSRLVSGPYLIKVYKWSNYLIVFAKDEYGNYTVPVKAMITSCGNATPTGTFYSPMKFRWLTMVGGSKAQWCTQISGDYLFHSVPYRIQDPTTLYTDLMYNYLGTTQSLGCIRLQAGDAKWIYDNCALGTEIYITPYESEGPIAKPGFSPIPSWHTWDPTDPTVHYLCEQHGCH